MVFWFHKEICCCFVVDSFVSQHFDVQPRKNQSGWTSNTTRNRERESDNKTFSWKRLYVHPDILWQTFYKLRYFTCNNKWIIITNNTILNYKIKWNTTKIASDNTNRKTKLYLSLLSWDRKTIKGKISEKKWDKINWNLRVHFFYFS